MLQYQKQLKIALLKVTKCNVLIGHFTDIVFFGESLPQQFHDCIEQDINQVNEDLSTLCKNQGIGLKW